MAGGHLIKLLLICSPLRRTNQHTDSNFAASERERERKELHSDLSVVSGDKFELSIRADVWSNRLIQANGRVLLLAAHCIWQNIGVLVKNIITNTQDASTGRRRL